MVGDSPTFPKRKKLRRRASWRDTLRAIGDEDEETQTKTIVRHRRSTSSLRNPALRKHLPKRTTSTSGDENGSLADEESSEDDRPCPEEERPIEDRVKVPYPPAPATRPVPRRSDSAMQRHQQELSQAVEAADVQAALSVKKKGGVGKNSEPIGTRLTMTSRTGYFQDRIISPSMVRFMPTLTFIR